MPKWRRGVLNVGVSGKTKHQGLARVGSGNPVDWKARVQQEIDQGIAIEITDPEEKARFLEWAKARIEQARSWKAGCTQREENRKKMN